MTAVRYAPYELSDEGVRWRLHRNEAALPAPEHVVRAIRSLDGEQVRRYPAEAQRELGELLARRLNVGAGRVVLANGADEILCALALLSPRPATAYCSPIPHSGCTNGLRSWRERTR